MWARFRAGFRQQHDFIMILIAAFVTAGFYQALPVVPQPAAGAQAPVAHVTPATGRYQHDIELVMRASHPEAEIYFTIDGSEPDPMKGTRYSAPIQLADETGAAITVRARAILPDGTVGPVNSNAYFMGMEATLPIVALVADPDDLWNAEHGIFARPEKRGRDWERPVDVILVEPDGRVGFQAPAGMRVHGFGSRLREKKSIRLYFRAAYGAGWLEYPLFEPAPGAGRFKRLVLRAGGQDYPFVRPNATLLRNALVAEMATQLDAFAGRLRPVIVTINGELWGIYNLRERIDEHFLAENYGIVARADSTRADRMHWRNLLDFAQNNDLNQPANYSYISTQIDIDNFIDYTLLEFYIANADWTEQNQELFRGQGQGGRWNWIFWDEDFGFGLAPRGDVAFDMVNWVFEESVRFEEGSLLLLRQLMTNEQFKQAFLGRAADLLNMTFTPQKLHPMIDTLAARLAPSITFETRRWPATSDWHENVRQMHSFVDQRPALMRRHFVDGLNLGGTVPLIVDSPSSGNGRVAVNGQLTPALPWRGEYFARTPVRLTAVPEPGFRFVGWEPATLPQQAALTIDPAQVSAVTPHFGPAEASGPQAGDVRIERYAIDGITAVPGRGRLQGDVIQLVVSRRNGVDLRGWRLTDNDTRLGEDEGSLIFGQADALADLPQGTTITIAATATAANDMLLPADDLDSRDGQLLLYVANENLDAQRDAWFNLQQNDNLVLLAPGPSEDFADDVGVAFVIAGPVAASGAPVSPDSFGVLENGVDGSQKARPFN